MELPKDLIREFAASTNDQQKIKKDTTCYGTVVIQNGGDFVQIDGADTLTPAIYTVGVKNGDRVLIMLKGRKALVVGNITSPYLMVGTLEANDGIIINGYLTTNPDRTTYDSTSAAGLTISNGGIGAWQGGATTKRWYGKNDGSFYASSAEISGTITAKDGSIGGFTIGENKLHTNQHTTWNANNSGVFISPDYIALGTGGLTYLKNDGTFQFGGANGVLFNGTKVTFGESVELNVNRITGSKSLGDWGINFDSGTMTIGNISASKIVSGTLTLGGNANASGLLRINNASGTQIGGWTKDGISATAGSIGGWSIKDIALYSENNGKITGLQKQGSGTYAIAVAATSMDNWATAPFRVTHTGALTASDATITGAITATSGKIGGTNGWDIGTGYLRASYTSGGTKYVGMGISGVAYAFFANASNSSGSDGVFRVGHDGKLVATDATITGAITATSLTLNSGVTIPASTGVSGLATVATSGKYTDLSNKPDLTVYIAKDGTIGSTPAAGANGFKVASSGVLTASNAVIYGTLYASAGTIGGLTLNGNTMYTSGHSAWNTAANGVFISGATNADYPISAGSGGAFRVNKTGALTCTTSVTVIPSSSGTTGYCFAAANANPHGGIYSNTSDISVESSRDIILSADRNVELEVTTGGISLSGWSISCAAPVTVNDSLTVTGDVSIALTSATCTLVSSVATEGTITCRKRGNVVVLEGAVKIVAISSRTKFATIPAGYRPCNTYYSFCTDSNRTLIVSNVNGDLQIDSRSAGNIWFTVTYLI